MASTIQSSLKFTVRKTRSQTTKLETSPSKLGSDQHRSVFSTLSKLSTPIKQKNRDSSTSFCSPPKKFCDSIERTQSDSSVLALTNKTPPKKNRSFLNESKDENTPEKKSPRSLRTSPRKTSDAASACIRLFKQDVTAYQELKSALTTSSAATLSCREPEIEVITRFLEDHLIEERPGSLYVSGAPGTGKTACLNQILQALKFQKSGHKTMFINCMTLNSVHSIYKRIWKELNGKDCATEVKSVIAIQKDLKRLMTNGDKMILLVLDEIDYLDSKDQRILYTIFEWASLEGSNLVLIGIANALDLTDRVLPRLQGHFHCRPRLLHFQPYSRDQLLTIIKDRLKQVSSDGQSIIQPAALQFCVRKVASVSGDVRKALDICRRAVEVVESDVCNQKILQPRLRNHGVKSSQKTKAVESKAVTGVELSIIAKIVNDIYGNTLRTETQNGENALPLHQKVLLSTLLLIVTKGKYKEVTVGKFHEVYCRICRKRQVSHLDLSDFFNICTLVESRGLIAIKSNKISRLSKVMLKADENEVEFALQDKVLLSSILEDIGSLTS